VTLQNGSSVLNVSDTSFVRGTVKKIGYSTFKFPIGAGWKYKPVKISAPSSVTDAFTATYFSYEQNSGTQKDTPLTYLSTCEFWNVTHPAGTSSVTLRIYWDPLTCDIDTLPTLRIARWNSSTLKWESPGAVTTSGDTLNGNFVTNAALSSFGNFVIAKSSPLPTVDAGSDIITCAGTRIKLGGNPTVSGGTAPYNISWSPVLYIDSLSSMNPELTVFNDADYIIRVIDADDATVYDTIHVKVNAAPQVNAGYDRFISIGSSTQLGSSNTATGGLPPYNYSWNPATALDDSVIEKPISTPVNSSTYTLTVTDANGCKGNDAVSVMLNLPSLNTAGYFGLLAADSILFSSTTLLNTRIGSRKFISENLGSTDTIVINSAMDSLAIVDLGNGIEKIKSIAGITIAGEFSGDTLYSGSYKTDLKATLNGVLTLSGDAHSVFIFNLNDSLVVSDGAEIKLDGINRSQVFFRIGKEFIVNGNATLPVNFLAEKNIIGGTISNATLLCEGKIIVDSGSFFPSVYEARISLVTRNDAADFLGFSSSNVLNPTGQFPSHLSDANVRLHLPMLNGRVLRFPQGGISKEWNSIDGWYINPVELIDPNSLPYAPPLACVEIQPVNKEDFDALPVDRFLELKYCLGGSGMQLLLPLNIFSNIDFQKNIIQHALDLNINVPYLELGNEFYLKAATCNNQQPQDYALNVNEYLNMVHNNPNFGGIKVGIVGSSWTTEDTQEDDLACRRKSWNANLFPLLSGTKPGDAITFHIYPETGFATLGQAAPFVKLEDVQPFFVKAFATIDAFSDHELKTLNDYPDLDAWITEYNLTDKAYNIHGSWAHSLFLSILTLRMLEFEKIKFVTCQTFLNDAGRGMFFGTDLGFRLGEFWSSIDTALTTKPWALTASGISMKMIGEAMRYSTNASMIEFVDAPQFENTEYTQLYGWTFDKELGDKQSIILNLSPEPQTINIGKLQPASAYEQVYCKNPLYYVTGKVWWPAPYNDYFNSAKRYYGDTISTPVNFDSVNVKIPDSTSVIILPPYSITRLYVLNKSTVWLRQSDNKVCAKDENSFDKVHASAAVNMYASGGASYQWAVGDQANDQQTSVSVGSASPVVNGLLKVFDTEGNLIGEKNDIAIDVLPLPPVQVTPTFFTNANSISSFTATATGAINYNWNPTLGLSSISGNTITISPSSSTNYQVIGTDENYCSKIQKISTIIAPSVSIHASNEGVKESTTPATIFICAGEEITLTADGAADEYKWVSSDGSVNSTSPSVTFIPSGNILITLTSTDHLAGTQSTTSAFIKLEPDIAAAAPD
ncbi:MAG: DUF3494 domain-containing protein, partial [Chitinophagales bacterium]|nr:DUF3494 domain-containing protein [Chitinophagales bacterium]